jgi:hypothetical protein
LSFYKGCRDGDQESRFTSEKLDLFIYKNYIIINFSLMTMPWLRQIVASLSPRRLRSVHVGFVVDKVALGQVFSKFLSFLCLYLSTVAPYSYAIWVMNSWRAGGCSSETESYNIDLNNTSNCYLMLFLVDG